MRRRIWLIACLSAAPCILLAAAGAPVKSAANRRNVALVQPATYGLAVRPFLRKYCLTCHSTKAKSGSLDLERFVRPEDLSRDPKPWQGVIDHLQVADMPPRGNPQPAEAERRRIISWVQAFLAAESLKHAGDPGNVPLRRLSNTEYNCTIRDLTGVDLQPAREFPADGAAGEGFTNASEALTDISPILLTKYLNSAKDIADHAVLLPDGIRFSPAKTRRDWTDECTARLRKFYSAWTGPEGKLDFKPYLEATVRRRDDILSDRSTVTAVASAEKLNPKYLAVLWKTLTDTEPTYPLDEIRSAWRKASPADVPALAADIAAWQSALWQVVRVGSYMHPVGKSYAESPSRQLAVKPVGVETQTIRLSVKPQPGQSDVVIRLASRELGSASGRIVWRKARFEGPGNPPLLLRDYARYGRRYEADYLRIFSATKRCLAAAMQGANRPGSQIEEIARDNGVDAELLKRWVHILDLAPASRGGALDFPGRAVPLAPLDRLTDRHQGDGAQRVIAGWQVGAGLPAVLSNSSNNLEHIPGDAAPHSVVVHPTPTEFVGITWTCPAPGRFRVSAAIIHAHPACGNGVAWWLEQRRGARSSMFAEGLIPLGGSAAPEEKTLLLEQGDTILLAVDAKNGDHGCDLTRVSFTLREQGGQNRVWDLAADTADSILAGNPHPDRYGNPSIWAFVKGPTRPVGPGTPSVIPKGSLLAEWRSAAADPGREADAAALGDRVQSLLSGPRPADNPASLPDRQLYDALVSADGPLLQDFDFSQLSGKVTGAPYGLRPDRFSPEGDLLKAVNGITEIRLPAPLFAGREFVVEGRLELPSPERAALLKVSADPVGPAFRWDGLAPVLAAPVGVGYRRFVAGIDRFRDCFPLFICFPNVIPNDEVVSLKMFHREDEPLKRLFLDEQQARLLDSLWAEHRFVSRQAVAEYKYLPLFIGFVTQDQPKEMVAYFEGQRPAFRKRAAEFEKDEAAAIPAHKQALWEFSSRAYRRPLSSGEKTELNSLYEDLLRKSGSHEEALRGVMTRVLVSPSFLFRIERAPAGRLAGPVSDWELASRLSYFFWSAPPDEELRALAAAGRLRSPDVLAQQARRMMRDARVRSLAVEFGAQWLHVRGFDEQSEKNERLFPTFDEQLRKSIYEETVLFFQDLFQNDRPMVNVLNADYTYLNERLAKHYGIPNVMGAEWRLVDHVRKYGRGGILGLATILTKESGASRTSPVLRGNWVVETLLGERLPRPPKDVPKLPEEDGAGGMTTRQQVEKHSKLPQCAFCHRRIDGYGFALEKYDPIGRLREKDLGGLNVDAHSKVMDGSEFEGIDGLRLYLMNRKKDVIIRLFCRRLLGYALGRATANSDQPLIDKMVSELNRNGGRISAAVSAIVSSPQFRMIRGRDYGVGG